MSKKIVILGAGYGGVLSALTLRQFATKEEVEITVVNQFPTHQIITELHRLAGGTVKEQAISFPFNEIIQRERYRDQNC